MDTKLFGADAPGRIVPITGDEHAFTPDPLPPTWRFPERVWPLLAEAKQQMGVLEGMGRNVPNPDFLLLHIDRP